MKNLSDNPSTIHSTTVSPTDENAYKQAPTPTRRKELTQKPLR